ncbi:MAG: hypothetical protein IPK52_07670 [Chloroflexi bacterium]|nr:hypothetical protein [Chloroflexota bacterium]
MSSTNVNVMVKEAVRALKANNKAEARSLLEKATELDPYSEQAWLWLSGVVETEDDQRTCLQNVLFINPGNENAKQGLVMLEAKSAAKPAPEPEPLNSNAFADFDLPSGNDWLAELDEMRLSTTSMPTTNPFNVPLDTYEDVGGEAFADPFGDPFGSADGPFSASVPAMPTIPAPPPNTMVAAKASDLEDDLDSLFGSGGAPSSPEMGSVKGKQAKTREKAAPEQKRDPLEGITEDADAGTLFGIIPAGIRPSKLPGSPVKATVGLRVLFALLILGNVAIVTLIFMKVTGT